jgi:adenylate kinase family enzyme
MVRRVLVKGSSGAGKSTLGRSLAQHLGVPFVELDALHHGPNWTAASASELQARVLAVLDDDCGWVTDGNYDSKLGRLLLDRAELIVWLDLPLHVKLVRLVRRTAGRVLLNEELWNGNRESLTNVLSLSGQSLFVWAVRTHFRHRRHWAQKLDGLPVVRLRSAREVEEWLTEFATRPAR